ncbi:unnamed protein product [Heterobilharzia americana]|nr:unnamed protein product [Heterobilharzia americana]
MSGEIHEERISLSDSTDESSDEENESETSFVSDPKLEKPKENIILDDNSFGEDTEWLKSAGKTAKCPQCNSKASRNDIRVLYCRNLKVLDTTDRDRALAELDRERKARQKAEQEAAELKARYDLMQAELLQLRDELQSARGFSKIQTSRFLNPGDLSNYQSSSSEVPSLQITSNGQYELLNTFLVSADGNCRSSTNPIFRGYGIRKVNSAEQRLVKYVHLHTQPIRDLAFHPAAQDGIVASASLDKTLRLTSLLNDTIVQTYQCPAGVWSCCWTTDSNRLFAGCANGSILLYDIRVTTGPLDTLFVPNNDAPVLGLQYLSPTEDHNTSTAGGLLVGQLNKVTFMSETSVNSSATHEATGEESVTNIDSNNSSEYVRPPDLQNNPTLPTTNWYGNLPTYKPHNLPLEGSLVSLSALPQRRQFLASYRPSQRLPRVRHLLTELQSDSSALTGTAYSCREIHNLWAGSRMKKLTRAKLFVGPSKESDLIAVAGSEDVGGALIWQCGDGTQKQVLKPPETTADNPVLDVCPIYVTATQTHYLALLTARLLHFYIWRY